MEYEDYGRKMLIYAGIAIVGMFFGLQAMVIQKCPYDKEDIVSITYKKGSPDIRTHNPKS